MPVYLNHNSPATSNLLTLCGVVLFHVLGLAWVIQQVTEQTISPPIEIRQPHVIGMLIATKPQLPVAQQPSQFIQPAPQLKRTPQPEIKQKTRQEPRLENKSEPTPMPAREAVAESAQQPSTPSENQPEWVAPPTTQPTAPPTTQPTTQPTAPLTPPRTDATHLKNPAPQYPALSRRLGEQGIVLLNVYILPDGSVGEIKLKQSSGFARLDNSALQTVKNWAYIPAKRGEQPIPFWYVQPISFVLNNKENLN